MSTKDPGGQVMLDDPAHRPRYHVPLSRLRVTGRRVYRGEDRPPEVTSAVTLQLAADPELHYPLPTAGRVEERTLGVELDADGRLVSLSVTRTGQGPALVSAAASLVGTAVGIAATAAGLRAGPLDAVAAVARARDGALHLMGAARATAPGPDALRARVEWIRARIWHVEWLLLLATDAATDGDREKAQVAARIEVQLARLRREQELAEARLHAATPEPPAWEEADEAWLFLDRLPATADVLGHAEGAPAGAVDLDRLTLGQVRRALRAWRVGLGDRPDRDRAQVPAVVDDTARRFAIVVCVDDAEDPPEALAGRVDAVLYDEEGRLRPDLTFAGAEDQPALVTRAPRAVEVSLYRLRPPAGRAGDAAPAPTDELVLHFLSRARHVVVDRRSDPLLVPLGKDAVFGHTVREVSIGAAGGISRISTTDTPGLAAAARALAGVPAEVAAGVGAVGDLVTAVERVQDLGPARELARLEGEKKRLDARIALDAARATATDLAESARLAARIGVLKAQGDLAAYDPPSAGARRAAAVAAARADARSRLELEQLRLEVAMLRDAAGTG